MLRYLTANPTAVAFDPDVIRIMSAALDGAWAVVLTDKVGFKLDGNPDAVRDLLAKHIVNLALLGERDGKRLTQGALDRLKL